ncbi:hybrid sensor histidine kinase/response regulator [Echinimonas agarilytica]|uniref:histidine kinase n=1 Tax=Echinimonas agarilytica TaxID=1215918 RepID=A0AA42B7S9_9GAMM|nr:PAS domain-containing hybrid sensor histidine kinase/response regulator [Echinimonas agarilytica]MCM2680064.1 hybrid sensor histidine kinase/response regulator [Echinimonas agarilytica]
MLNQWQLIAISLGYICLLFALAWFGDLKRFQLSDKVRPWVYSLSLGVYCSSWSFLGTTAQSSNSSFSHLPIYLGPIALFLFAWPLIQRMMRVSHSLQLTSIADLIAARFGKSQGLALSVTLVALIGTMPYLALQIKAIVYSIRLMSPSSFSDAELGFLVTAVLASFTVWFGIRTVDMTERHPGIMLAIAFESVIKVIAFLLVGLVISFVVFSSPVDLWQQAQAAGVSKQQLGWPDLTTLLGSTVVVSAAFLCLPRQFHVMIVESRGPEEAKTSRWIFPAYLMVFALFAAPLGVAGFLLLGDSVAADAYVLMLPQHHGFGWLSILAFLGALSAASSMVIVSSIALSTMVSNEIILPLMFKRGFEQRARTFEDFNLRVLFIRRALIVLVILLGFAAFLLAPPDTLSSLGEIAFAAIAQLTPGLLAAFYWRKANRIGVALGLLLGSTNWLVWVVFPHFGVIDDPDWLHQFGMSALTTGTLLSLLTNVFGLWFGSSWARPSVVERIQAGQFLEKHDSNQQLPRKIKQASVSELTVLAARFVGESRAEAAFKHFERSMRNHDIKAHSMQFQQMLNTHCERLLGSVMGASSAKLLLSSALEGRDIALDEIAQLVEQTSTERLAFSQNLLQGAIENAGEGISVVDTELRLVAWNQRYIDLFEYPKALVGIGKPIADMIRFNAKRGLCGEGNVEQLVRARLMHLRRGTPHTSERTFPGGRVILSRGNPMPGGGFVMTYSDVTSYREAQQALEQTNEELEIRVNERTQELQQVNDALEQANYNKSHYLRTCSHDLMQPLEAARLFSSALGQDRRLDREQRALLGNLNTSLSTASELLNDMGDVARIESGRITAAPVTLAVQDVFTELANEFSALASEYNVEFHVQKNKLWIETDARMLRRVLQNLLANAFRYASGHKVVLGCRRHAKTIDIQVIDSGPGIDKTQQNSVFQAFTRLDQNSTTGSHGLGLGLNIAQGFCRILGHELSLKSKLGSGCAFTVTATRAFACSMLPTNTYMPQRQAFQLVAGRTVLCVDNDLSVLHGMTALLSSWNANVIEAQSIQEALDKVNASDEPVSIMLVDHQLDHGETGLELMDAVRELAQIDIPGVLITADRKEGLQEYAEHRGYGFMRKMVKPARLRAMIQRFLDLPDHNDIKGHE